MSKSKNIYQNNPYLWFYLFTVSAVLCLSVSGVPYKVRSYKYLDNEDRDDFGEDYPQEEPTELKPQRIKINHQGEDCDDEGTPEGRGISPEVNVDYPQNPRGEYPQNHRDDYPQNHRDDYPQNPRDDYPRNHHDDYPQNPRDDYPRDDYPQNPRDDYPQNPRDGYPQNSRDDYDTLRNPVPTRKYTEPQSHNVIPHSGHMPEYPQWGAHEPKNVPPKDYNGGRVNSKSPDNPEITNVQGMEPESPKSPYPGFSRRCDSYFDCDFATPYMNASEEMDGSTWFACDGRFCICELFGVSRDEVPLRVTWSKELRQCLSDLDGPCGRHNGLNIYCEMGYVCENHFCQKPGGKPKKPQTTPCPDEDSGDDPITSLFSFIFFPSNTVHNVLNNSLHGIVS